MPTQEDTAALHAELESVQLQRQLAREKADLNFEQLLASQVFMEGFGDIVDRTEYLRDDPTFLIDHTERISLPKDRDRGDYSPFWVSEQEHAIIRGVARYLCGVDEVAISALENLTNYTIGETGFDYDISARSPADEELAQQAQAIVEAFFEDNDWEGDLEREIFTTSRVDGEAFVCLKPRGGFHVQAELVDSAFVTEPDDVRTLEDFLGIPAWDWKYGVATDLNRPQTVNGYFVQWGGDRQDWDFFTPDQLEHIKINAPRIVKRGMPDYHPVATTLERSDRLFNNTVIGASVQAAIAFIREHAPGMSADAITSAVRGKDEFTRRFTTPKGTTRTENMQKARPGTVVDVKANTKYHAGPMGSPRGGAYVDIMQAALRRAGIRWQMPEYMISGDASNSNFASSLVAEAPFSRSSAARQSFYGRRFRKIIWKVLKLVAERGFLGGLSIGELQARLQLAVIPPSIAVRDKLEEHQIRREEHEAGILSLESWAAEAGRDFAEERVKIEAEQGGQGQEPPTTDLDADT